MSANNGLVDLNSTSRKLLTQLPGVTKDIAYKIVNYRSQHGGFSDWSDVQTAIGFPPAKMAASRLWQIDPGKCAQKGPFRRREQTFQASVWSSRLRKTSKSRGTRVAEPFHAQE